MTVLISMFDGANASGRAPEPNPDATGAQQKRTFGSGRRAAAGFVGKLDVAARRTIYRVTADVIALARRALNDPIYCFVLNDRFAL
ncbi:MAG: hypothetical protein P4L76_12375 [Beijerinckiaceae bacterium]|nr:hypothetical protein [Beijerinckiaceae bacterium]